MSHNNALTSNADGNAILLTYVLSAPLLLCPSLSLWVSGIVSLLSNKADLIPAIASQTAHSILGLTETWIRPEDSATPATVSNDFSFSHTPHQVRKGGGTGLLISNNWRYSTYAPQCNNYLLEYHAITVTAPVKLHVVVISCPPGQLGTFLEELDGLLSSFSENGSQRIVFGDFNINLNMPYAVNFLSLLASFDLKRLTTTSAHKSSSQLDLIYKRNYNYFGKTYTPLTTTSLHLTYILLLLSHKHLYQLPLDKTLFPFHYILHCI